MSREYITYAKHPIISLMKRNNLTRQDLCEGLHVTQKTLTGYLVDPSIMQLKQIYTLAGLVHTPIETLVYMLIRNKPSINKQDKWYLEDIKAKQKDVDMG